MPSEFATERGHVASASPARSGSAATFPSFPHGALQYDPTTAQKFGVLRAVTNTITEVRVARAAERARAADDRIVERVLARLTDVPHADRLAGVAGAGIVASLVAHLFDLLAKPEKGRPSPREKTASPLAGMLRELPAPTFFILHHVAVEEVCRSFQEAADSSAHGKEAVANAAFDMFLQATKELHEAYAAASQPAVAATAEDAMEAFLTDLLSSEIELASLEARAARFNLDLRSPLVALAFQPQSAGTGGGAAATAAALAVLSTIGSSASIGRHGESMLAFVPAEPDWRPVEAALAGHRAVAGGGLPAVGIVGIRRSAREALRALALARGAAVSGRVFLYRRLMAYDFIRAGSPFSRILAGRLLGGVADDPKALATLREFCRQGYNVKLTAAALRIHPHTLTYRLAGMRNRHGLDLVSAEGRLAVHLALLAHEVEGVMPPDEASLAKARD